jgi:hypothetical protein
MVMEAIHYLDFIVCCSGCKLKVDDFEKVLGRLSMNILSLELSCYMFCLWWLPCF